MKLIINFEDTDDKYTMFIPLSLSNEEIIEKVSAVLADITATRGGASA